MKSLASLRRYFGIVGLWWLLTSAEGVYFGIYASKVAPSATSAVLGIVQPLLGSLLGASALYLAFSLQKYLYAERVRAVKGYLIALAIYLICVVVLSPSPLTLMYAALWLLVTWNLSGRVKKYIELRAA